MNDINTPIAKEIRLKIIKMFGEEYLHTLNLTAKTDIHEIGSWAKWSKKHIENQYQVMIPNDGGVVYNPGQNNLILKSQ